MVAGSSNVRVPLAPASGAIASTNCQAVMTSLGALLLITPANIGPDVVPACMFSGVPGGLLVSSTTPARAAPPRQPTNTINKRKFFIFEPFPCIGVGGATSPWSRAPHAGSSG